MSSGAPESHSIGEVIARMRAEFPELSVSKVRFLEAHGLVKPVRSAAGYRLFSDSDIKRIAFVLREQRDNYLPLKVIKSRLAAWERGDRFVDVSPNGPPPESYFAASGVAMSAEEIAGSTGMSSQDVAGLIEQKILMPLKLPDGSLVFRDDDLITAKAARRLLEHGLEVRHLRSLRIAADRRVELLNRLVAPIVKHRNPENRRRAAEILAETAHAGAEMEESIVRSRIKRLLER